MELGNMEPGNIELVAESQESLSQGTQSQKIWIQ